MIGVGIGISRWRNGTALVPPPVVVPNQTAYFPAATPAAAGGFKPFDGLGFPVALTGTVTRIGGPALTRTWTIDGNGDLVANGTPAVDHGVVFRCDLVGGGTVDLIVDAATYDGEAVATPTQYDTLIRSSARLSGRTHLVRCRDFILSGGATGQWPNTGATTVQAERPDVRKPRFIGTNGLVDTATGAITLRGIHFHAPSAFTPQSWNFSSPVVTRTVINSTVRNNILIDACVISSDYQDAGTGYWASEAVLGVESRVNNFEVRNTIVENMMYGLRTAGGGPCSIVATNCTLRNMHGDFYNQGGGPIIVIGGSCYNMSGTGNTFHQDILQTNGNVLSTLTVDGMAVSLYMEGVVVAPGPRGLRRPGEDPAGGAIQTIAVATNLTLDPLIHSQHLVNVTASNVTITLPPIASVAVDDEFVITAASVTGTVIASADTASHATFPAALASLGFTSFKSNGTQWVPKTRGTRLHNIGRTADLVCRAHDISRTHIFDTAAAPRTVTLPPSPADGAEIHVQVALNGQNPVTVFPNAGQGMDFGGNIVASHSVPTIARSSTYIWNAGTGRWKARGTHFGNQGVFTNQNTFPGAALLRGCIIMLNEAWGWRLESSGAHANLPPYTAIHHCAIIPYTAVADWNGDGVLDDGDGLDTTNLLANIEYRGPSGKPFVVDRCVANLIIPAAGITHTDAYLTNNDVAGMTLTDSFAGDVSKLRQFIAFNNLWPATPEEALATVIRAAGHRVGQNHGPLDWWDFATQTRKAQPNMTATVLPVYDGGTVQLQLSNPVKPITKTGNITLFNGTTGLTVETFDIATSPAVVVQGSLVTITPTTPLTVNGNTYSVRFDGTCFPSLYTAAPLAVADNSLSFTVRPIVYPTIVSAASTVRLNTATQYESDTFTLDGTKRYVINVALRASTSSDPIATFTRGAAGRAFGTGTAFPPTTERHLLNVHNYAWTIDPTTSPGAETIQVQLGANCQQAGFEVIEVIDTLSFGTISGGTPNTATPSASITTQAVYSTVLGLVLVNSATFSAGAGNTVQFIRTAPGSDYGAITQDAPTVASQSVAFNNTPSAQTALILIELLSDGSAASVAPTVNVAGSFTGNRWVGQVLTGTATTFNGTPAPTVTYQWYRFVSPTETNPANGTAISGATSLNYTIVTADDTFTLRRLDTGTNTGGSVAQITAGSGVIGIAPLASAINADGWSATYSAPPTFDPVGTPEVFTLERPSWDASGNAVTLREKATWMKRIRQPFPNQTSLSVDQAASNKFIYSTDALLGGVTNNSTRPAPKPIAAWMTPDVQMADAAAGTYKVRLAVAHGHARAGSPVVAVQFITTDGTNTVTQTVTAQTSVQYTASGQYVPCYECDIDLSTLTTSTLCTVDVKIFPWVGAVFQASIDADVYPSPNFCTLKFINDKAGTYGRAYAYVDLAGTAGGVVSTTAATAQATPFQTITQAAAAIKTFNNTNFARNSTGGGIVRLNVGNYPHGNYSASNSGAVGLIIEAANPANKATTVIEQTGANGNNSIPAIVTYRNLTIRNMASNALGVFDSNQSAFSYIGQLVFDNVTIDRNGFTVNALIYRPGRFMAINCDTPSGDAGQANIVGIVNKTMTAIGCSGMWSNGSTYNLIGCTGDNNRTLAIPATAARVAGVGMMTGWNKIKMTLDQVQTSYLGTIGARGFAIVGNVVEQTLAGASSALVSINGDNDTSPTENVVVHCNTFVGERMNGLYQDTGSTLVPKSWYEAWNIFTQANSKTETFPTANTARVGNWPVVYHVEQFGTLVSHGSTDNVTYGTGSPDRSWMGELIGLGSAAGTLSVPLTGMFVSAAYSTDFGGSGLGDGDYRPAASGSPIPRIQAGLAPYAFDQRGVAISNTGSGWAGGLQQ